jgi:hypothetical protein
VFFRDQWRLHDRLSLSTGIRYDYESAVKVGNGLMFFPVLENNDPGATLLSNLKLDFSGPGTGHPLYKPDRNNFGPQAGVAFRIDNSGNTVVRAGFGVYFIEDVSTALFQEAQANEGLRRYDRELNLSARVSVNLPTMKVPEFKAPLSLSDNYLQDSLTQVVLPDPALRSPYIQEWMLGLSRRINWGTVEARYVGNHAVHLVRGLDLDRMILRENGFLDDFQRAVENGRQAQAATGVYNPNYNPAIPGSRPLTVFPLLPGGGNLSSPTFQNYLLNGSPAGMAYFYQYNRINGPINFFSNPNAVGAWLLTNHDESTHNSLSKSIFDPVGRRIS